MAMQSRDTFSPREQIQMDYDERMLDKQIAHAKELKAMELEVLRVETKWASLLRLPLMILKLPVLLVLGVGYVVGSFRKDYKPVDNFWDLLK